MVSFCRTAVTSGPHEERLIYDILNSRNYTALARPVAEESEALVVNFGLTLQQIIKIVSRTFITDRVTTKVYAICRVPPSVRPFVSNLAFKRLHI